MRIYNTNFIKTAFIFHASKFSFFVRDLSSFPVSQTYGCQSQIHLTFLSLLKNAEIKGNSLSLDQKFCEYLTAHLSDAFRKAMASLMSNPDSHDMSTGLDLQIAMFSKDEEVNAKAAEYPTSAIERPQDHQRFEYIPNPVESSYQPLSPPSSVSTSSNHRKWTGHKHGRTSQKRRFYSDSRGALDAPVSRAMRDKPVAIIGGGIGGMALALALQKSGVPVRLFEKDDSFAARRQGYGLTLQQGVMPLRSLGFTSIPSGVVTTKHASYKSNGDVLGIYGHDVSDQERHKSSHLSSTSTIDLNPNPNPSSKSKSAASPATTASNSHGRLPDKGDGLLVGGGSSPPLVAENRVGVISIVGRARHQVHLPRQVLRELLMDQIEPDSISWSKKLVSYEDSCGTEGVSLHFSDGSSFKCSLLVGADGIYSVVRNLKLPEARLVFLDLIVILGITRNVEGDENKLWVRQWLDGSTRVFTMPFDPEHTMWQMSFPADEPEALRISASAHTLREEALRRCSGWHSDLTRILEATEHGLVSGHPVYDRDPMESAQLRGSDGSRVTLIGDAVHPMSPFKGQGANQALLDAAALADAISLSDLVSANNRTAPISEVLAAFERDMCARSAAKVLKSRTAAVSLHSPAALVEGNMTRASVASAAIST